MKIKFNVIKNKITESHGIDFTPKKSNDSDTGFDVRAYAIKVDDNFIWENWDSYCIGSNNSVTVGIGASLVQGNEIQVATLNDVHYLFNLMMKYINANVKLLTQSVSDNEKKEMLEGLNNELQEYGNLSELSLIPSSQIQSRSGLAFKSGITAFNGQIDKTYDNQIWVKLTNNSNETYAMKFGERIGQLRIDLIPKIDEVEVNNVETMQELDLNGRGGFGSTGKI
jgi:hypothetical protein